MTPCALVSPECRGRLEWHHCLGKNRLKREFPYGAFWSVKGRWVSVGRREADVMSEFEPYRTLDDILGDTRNRVWLCSHHHELVTNGRLEVSLPQSVWEFAAEFGLTAQLENDIARRAA